MCWQKEKNHPRHSPYVQLWGEDEDWRGHQEGETNSRWWTGEKPETRQQAKEVQNPACEGLEKEGLHFKERETD